MRKEIQSARLFTLLKWSFLAGDIRIEKRKRLPRRADGDIRQCEKTGQWIITVNMLLPKEEQVVTVVHEILHLYDPVMTEEEVEKRAHEIYRTLAPSQLGFIEFLLSSDLEWEYIN